MRPMCVKVLPSWEALTDLIPMPEWFWDDFLQDSWSLQLEGNTPLSLWPMSLKRFARGIATLGKCATCAAVVKERFKSKNGCCWMLFRSKTGAFVCIFVLWVVCLRMQFCQEKGNVFIPKDSNFSQCLSCVGCKGYQGTGLLRISTYKRLKFSTKVATPESC